MKKIITIIALFLLVSSNGYSQVCEGNKVTVSLTNITTTASSIEFDINISNSGAGNSIKLASLSGALIHSIGFANKGTFSVVTQPSQADFPNFKDIKADYANGSSQLRWTNNPVQESQAVSLPLGTAKKFARFRFALSDAKLPSDFVAKLKFQEYVQKGRTAINANVYCNGNSSSTALANGKGNESNGISNGFIDFKINPSTVSGEFSATAYPNPFSDSFHLTIKTTLESEIQIKVYDMLGKLIEKRAVRINEIENQAIGSNYPAGIYNINVSQGDNSQSIRIIRR